MDKEKLLTELTAKIGQTSLSGRTISEYVNAIFPGITDDAMVNDAFYETHKAILKSMEGQLSNEVATKVNTFKTDWEKNHSTQQQQQQQQQTTTEFKDTEEYKNLMSELENLKNARTEESKQAKIAELRKTVLGKSKELNVSNKAIWDDVIGGLQIGEDSTAEALIASAKTTYEAKLKSYLGDSAVPYSGNISSTVVASPEAAKAKRDEFRQRMIDKGRLPNPEATK